MFFILLIGGVVSLALIVNNFNNKLRRMRDDFAEQIVIMRNKITALEEKLQSTELPIKDTQEPQTTSPIKSDTTPSAENVTRSQESIPGSETKILDQKTTDKDLADTQPIAPVKTPHSQTKPSEPNAIEVFFGRVITAIKDYFTKGNTVAKVGVIVLFFGVAFLVKYASDQGILPIELRLSAVALGGIILTQFGWRLRDKKPGYALAVQGGGVGVLFITTFAAFQIYSLIPALAALGIMILLAGTAILMAVLQNSMSLASLGVVGGFLAPLLASTGQGSHVVLFSYYAILNLIIVGVSYRKAWRLLNLIGFTFTYIISSLWGVFKYSPDDFWSTEPFIVFYFLVYVAVPILFAKNTVPKLKGFVDGTLVFGNSVIFFGLQAKIISNIEFGLAYTALALSLFYMLLGRWLYTRSNTNYRLIFEAFLSLGVVFATVTIPLAFEGKITSAVWAIEAAGIYWLSLRQNKTLGRLFATALILFASLAFFVGASSSLSQYPFLNSYYLGAMLVALGFYICSYFGFNNKDKLFKFERFLVPTFFVFGSWWWIQAGYHQFETHFTYWWAVNKPSTETLSNFPSRYVAGFSSLYLLGLSTLLAALGRKLKWIYLTRMSYVAIIFVVIHTFRTGLSTHPFAYGGYYVWPLIILAYYLILKISDSSEDTVQWLRRSGHALIFWIFAIVFSNEASWLIEQADIEGRAWSFSVYGLIPAGLACFVLVVGHKIKWPFARYMKDYLKEGVGVLLGFVLFWLMVSNWSSSGKATPLPYIPILNPLELTHLFCMMVIPVWLLRLKSFTSITPKQIGIGLGLLYFYWLNGVLARAVHHFAGVPFEFDELYQSSLVQMSLSIYWSIIGISLMIIATRKNFRWLWISGIVLMGIVVGKLFLIDLSRSGTVERIVSFISVGLVLLAVGYFSPIPPKKEEKG